MKARQFRLRTSVQHAARALVETLEHRRLLAAGDIDPSFGDGSVLFDHRSLAVHAVLPDGRFYTGGGIDGDGGIIRRHLPNGELDATWDGSGVRNTNTQFSTLALTPDQKVVIAGTDLNGNLVIERYLATGRLDSTFGGSGIRKFDFADNNLNTASQAGFHDVLVRGDGKIVAAGLTARPGIQGVAPVVVRVNPDGSFDGSFRSGAVFLNQFDIATDVELQSDGRMIVGGFSGGSDASTFVRVNKDGSIDSAFGTGGKIDIAAGGDTRLVDIEIVGADRIVFTAEVVDDGGDSNGLLGRLGRNGDIDASFGNGGFVRRHDVHFGDVDVAQDGKLVIGGIFENEADGARRAALSRLNPDGSFDSTFAGDGLATFQSGNTTSGGPVAIQGNAILQSISSERVFPEHGITVRESFLHRVQGSGEVEPPPPDQQEPFIGRPWTINENIEAEGFDFGGQGVAYHDQEPQNLGGAHRPNEGVDIHANDDGGPGGWNVGWVNNGEYLEYTINVPRAGAYVFDARIATPKMGARIFLSLDNSPLATLSVPNTGSFFNWRTITGPQVNLPAGTHVLRVAFGGPTNIGGLTNLNWIKIRSAEDPSGGGGNTGERDPSFGTNGRVITNLGFGKGVQIVDAVTDASGRLLVAATAYVNDLRSAVVARFNNNGTLDTTFGDNGRRVIPWTRSAATDARDIEIAPDGKIVVLVHAGAPGIGGFLFVARLTANGQMDTTFNVIPAPGFHEPGVTNFINEGDFGGDIEVLSDGAILVGATAQEEERSFIITRVRPDGEIDESFGRSGHVAIDMETTRSSHDYLLGIEVTAEGKIAAGGVTRLSSGQRAWAAARLNANGSFDTSYFGGRAYIVDPGLSFVGDQVRGSFVLQQPGNRAVIAVNGTEAANLRLFQFNDRARPDSAFGNNGVVDTGLRIVPMDLERQPDAKLVIAGFVFDGRNEPDIALLRFHATGARDGTFPLITPTSPPDDRYSGLFLANNFVIATGFVHFADEEGGVIDRYVQNDV